MVPPYVLSYSNCDLCSIDLFYMGHFICSIKLEAICVSFIGNLEQPLHVYT